MLIALLAFASQLGGQQPQTVDVTLPAQRFIVPPGEVPQQAITLPEQTVTITIPPVEPAPIPVVATAEMADLVAAYDELAWQIKLAPIPWDITEAGNSRQRAFEHLHAVYRELYYGVSLTKQLGLDGDNVTHAELRSAYERWKDERE